MRSSLDTIAELVSVSVGSKCAVYASQMRVRIDDTKYVYPDASVVCGDPDFDDENEVILLNPTVVVEVTSPASVAHDHVEKVAYYGEVSSIEGYLILDEARFRGMVHTYRRWLAFAAVF